MSHHGIISQLGFFLGIGSLLSLTIVLFVLPGFLYVCDGLIRRTTLHAKFYSSREVTAHENQLNAPPPSFWLRCSYSVPRFPALAAGDGTGALAEETPEPSAKEEVIYVTLDAAGDPSAPTR